MPSLKLCKRTWKFAEDDFVYSSITLGLIRLILVLCAALYTGYHENWIENIAVINQAIFASGMMVCGLQIILYLTVASISSIGGVMEVRKRRKLSIFMLIHLIFLLLEIILYCLCIWRITDMYNAQGWVILPHFVAILCWSCILLFMIVFEIISWCKMFDKNGAIKYAFYNTFLYGQDSGLDDDGKRSLIKKMRELSRHKWKMILSKRVGDGTETGKEGKQEAIEEASAVIADVFTDLDLTHSDVLMGLMLLRWQTTQWLGGHSKVPAQYVREMTDPVLEDVASKIFETDDMSAFEKLRRNWLHISRLRQYCNFVNASYGWFYYYIQNVCDCKAIYRLCNKLSFRRPTVSTHERDLESGIKGPGGCLCSGKNAYLAAFLEMSSLSPENILIFEIAETFYNATIMLVIDEKTEAIVLIVRGTLSGDDTLVDLLATGEPLRDIDKTLPAGKRFLGHGGMVRVSRNICERMIREQWVEKARQIHNNYPLVLCGHSLGAGLVSLMSVLLKPKYPELRAYAFSPPGALMNEKLAQSTHEFLCSVVYGYDVVGRTSVSTIEDLRARLLHAVVVCNVPKWRILGSRILITLMNILFPCCRLPKVGEMIRQLDPSIQEKLIHPDLEDVYVTEFGANFKENENEMIGGVSRVERLLKSERSLLNWKNPNIQKLLRIPRPYSTSLCPDELENSAENKPVTADTLFEALKNPQCGIRVLHVIEVDADIGNDGAQRKNMRNYLPPPIGLWADNHSFNSVLVHPKMLFNHSSLYVSAALDRIYASLTWPDKCIAVRPPNTYVREFKFLPNIRRSEEEQDGKYCQIRRLK